LCFDFDEKRPFVVSVSVCFFNFFSAVLRFTTELSQVGVWTTCGGRKSKIWEIWKNLEALSLPCGAR